MLFLFCMLFAPYESWLTPCERFFLHKLHLIYEACTFRVRERGQPKAKRSVIGGNEGYRLSKNTFFNYSAFIFCTNLLVVCTLIYLTLASPRYKWPICCAKLILLFLHSMWLVSCSILVLLFSHCMWLAHDKILLLPLLHFVWINPCRVLLLMFVHYMWLYVAI